jgi:hypothetical protein
VLFVRKAGELLILCILRKRRIRKKSGPSETILKISIKSNNQINYCPDLCKVRGPFEKFVDWRQCAAVMQREVVTVLPSCSGGGNVVVA